MADIDITKDLEHDLCACGRHAWRVHCPHCGSYHNYSFTRQDSVIRSDGTTARLTVYRCRRCAAVFNDDDWKLRCGAPNILLTSGGKAGRKAATATKFESLDDAPELYKLAMEKIMKDRGIK